MAYVSPTFIIKQSDVTRDEWWPVVLVLLFIIRVYSNYALDQAVQECKDSGGTAKVSSSFFGSSWQVECYKE
ncbi:hypothetical protein [Paenibacillus sedimenti]|uniref:Uncharacterized protein n=1 Tax=Paenibacillus sedimenti TaxID=2770274 RepID=A0A926KM90_9BACL|nr:hypothetical protein [Paenibacillus sedimenti]MBD0379606.1 hypothetical protein [Paenibacillus sedimenti]